MKHRQIGNPAFGTVNPDGHAIGLDIGATAVRAAVLSHGTLEGKPAVTVHGLGEEALPFGAVSAGVVQNEEAVTTAIRNLWQNNKFDCRNVILGISNPQIVVRDLTMPRLEPAMMAKALPYQAREVVPFPIDQALMDFAALDGPDASADTVSGLLVASPKDPVIVAVRAAERAGLRVARVDLSTFAALRAIAQEDLAVEAVVDLGAHVTSIVIHNHGVPKVVRTVTRGGQEVTDRLAERLNVEAPEAERIKRESGLMNTNREISTALADSIRPLISEIRSSINYFAQITPGAQLQRISLTGGGSALVGIAEALTDQLGVPAGVVEPLQHVRNRWATKDVLHGSEEAATAVSVGLAMGAAA